MNPPKTHWPFLIAYFVFVVTLAVWFAPQVLDLGIGVAFLIGVLLAVPFIVIDYIYCKRTGYL